MLLKAINILIAFCGLVMFVKGLESNSLLHLLFGSVAIIGGLVLYCFGDENGRKN
jgi:drug/metabolite transporter (DMT)-like permease